MMKKGVIALLCATMLVGSIPETAFAVNETSFVETTVETNNTEEENEATTETSEEVDLEESDEVPVDTEETIAETLIDPNEIPETEVIEPVIPEEMDIVAMEATATSGKCGDNLTWELKNGVLTISGTGDMYDYTWSNKPEWGNTFTTLVLEEGITSIGNIAFSGLESLTCELKLPSSLKRIGNYAFTFSSFRGKLIIPENVTEIGQQAFGSCPYFSGDLVIPANVKTIKSNAFWNCTGFDGNLIIEKGVGTIMSGTFSDCSNLSGSVYLPEKIDLDISDIFFNCTSIESFYVPFATLEYYSVFKIQEFRKAIYDENHKQIGKENLDATIYCVKNSFFEKWALENGLKVEHWPGSREVHTANGLCGDNLSWSLDKGVLTISGYGPMWYDYTKWEEGFPWHEYRDEIHEIILDDRITSIAPYAFLECPVLGDLILPRDIEEVGSWAFGGTDYNGIIDLPDGLKAIGDAAFIGCNNLCGDLTIPDSVTIIGSSSFYSTFCTQRRYGKYGIYYKNSGKLKLSNSLKIIPTQAFLSCGFEGDLIIPEGVETIEKSAFYSATFNGDVIIPDTVTEIGKGAFKCLNKYDNNCSLRLILPKKLEKIDEELFAASKFSDIYINASVTEIAEDAFSESGYSNPRKNIDATLHCIKDSFAYNWAKEHGFTVEEWDGTIPAQPLHFSYEKTAKNEVKITGYSGVISSDFDIPDTIDNLPVTEIASEAFMNVKIPGSISLPDSIRVIGARAFKNCTVTGGTLELSEGLETIDDEAFLGLNFAGYLTIPSTVKKVGKSAFENCNLIGNELMISYFPTESTLDVEGSSVSDTSMQLHSKSFYNCGLTAVYLPPYVDLSQADQDIFWTDSAMEISSSDSKVVTLYGMQGSTAEALASKYPQKYVFKKWDGSVTTNFEKTYGHTVSKEYTWLAFFDENGNPLDKEHCKVKDYINLTRIKNKDKVNGKVASDSYIENGSKENVVKLIGGAYNNMYIEVTYPEEVKRNCPAFGTARGILYIAKPCSTTADSGKLLKISTYYIKNNIKENEQTSYIYSPMLGKIFCFEIQSKNAIKNAYISWTDTTSHKVAYNEMGKYILPANNTIKYNIEIADEHDSETYYQIGETVYTANNNSVKYTNWGTSDHGSASFTFYLPENTTGSHTLEILKYKKGTLLARKKFLINIVSESYDPNAKGAFFSSASLKGSTVSFEVDDNIPVLGGNSFSIDLNLPAILSQKIQKTDAGLKIYMGAYANDDFDKSTLKNKDSLKEKIKELKSGKKSAVVGAEIAIAAGALLEYNQDGSFNNGSIYGAAKADYSSTWYYFPWGVPTYVSVGGEIKGSYETTLIQNKSEKYDPSIYNTNISATATANAGVGVKDVLAGELGVNNIVTYQDKATYNATKKCNEYDPKVWLTMDGEVKFVAGIFESSYTFAEKSWQLFPELVSDSKPDDSIFTLDFTDSDSYIMSTGVVQRDYTITEDMFTAQDVSNIANADTSVLVNGIYPYGDIKYIKYGDTAYLFYLNDDTTRPLEDKTVLSYRYFNGSTWSEELYVDHDKTADLYYDVAVGKDGIYVAWQNAKKSLVGVTDFSQLKGAMELGYAKIEKDTITLLEAPETDHIPMMINVITGDDQNGIAWVENSEDLYLNLTEGTNQIYLYDLATKEKNVLDSFSEEICTLDAGILNGDISVALTKDTDKNTSSINDREILIYSNGKKKYETQNQVLDSNPKYSYLDGNSVIFFYEDGNYYYFDGTKQHAIFAADTQFGSDDYVVLCENGQTALIWKNTFETLDSTGVTFTTSLYKEGKWSTPVDMNEVEGYANSFAGKITENGDIYYYFISRDTENQSLCKLMEVKGEEKAYLDISAVYYDVNDDSKLHVSLRNNGKCVANQYTIKVFDSYNQLVHSKTQTIPLAVDAIQEFILDDFDPGVIDELLTFKVVVEVGEREVDSEEFNIGGADFAISCEQSTHFEKDIASIAIENIGTHADSAMITVLDENGVILDTISVEPIEPNTSWANLIGLTEYWNMTNCSHIIMSVSAVNGNETNTLDNTVSLVNHARFIEEINAYVEAEKYVVTFYPQNGTSSIQSDEILSGETCKLPAIPTKDGNIFMGWYTEKNGQGSEFTEQTPVNANLTVYAKWSVSGEDDKIDVSDSDNGILPEDIPADGIIPEGLWIAGTSDQTYTGTKLTPSVRVYDHTTRLTEKKDYTIVYKNNINANDASVEAKAPTITVTGKGNYAGKETATFRILPADISTIIASTDTIYVAKNNKVQKLIPNLYSNGKKLINKKDFKVTYPQEAEANAYKDAGTYKIHITAVGNYIGEGDVTLVITDQKLISKATVGKLAKQTYTGQPITPTLVIKDGKTALVENQDYEIVSYENNTEIGTATISIKGINQYVGTRKITFQIIGQDLKKAKVSGLTTKLEYTGNDITQTYQLTIKDKNREVTLIENKDYVVSYENNRKVGKATIIFKGINAYSGVVKKTFTITPYQLATDSLKKITTPASITAVYAKGGSKPHPELKYGNQVLQEGTDYTLAYKNNTVVNDGSNPKKLPTITVTGKGNFQGKLTLHYTITRQDLEKLTLHAPDKAYAKKKNAYQTKLTLQDLDGKALSAGKDYNKTISYTYVEKTTTEAGEIREADTTIQPNDILPVGTKIKVTLTAPKNSSYTGTISTIYQIRKADFSKAKVTVKNQTYTGKEIKPGKDAITVKLGKVTLQPEDYEIVSYGGNTVNKGTNTIVLRGVGNYGGTITTKYTIQSKGFTWWWRK